jgi:hypothetical protein
MAWTTPRTWATSELVTAAIMNAHVRDNLAIAFPGGTDWTTWSPSYANLTTTSGTIVARYNQVGDIVTGYWSIVFGASSAMGTSPTISLPVTASSSYYVTTAGSFPIGTITCVDSGTAVFVGYAGLNSTTTMAPYTVNAGAAASANRLGLTSTVPMTWTTSDALLISFQYEAA